MDNTPDLRIVKTIQIIETTFFTELASKSFDQITVTGLARQARISKGTFYNHYLDKYDLARQLIDSRIKSLNTVLKHQLNTSWRHNILLTKITPEMEEQLAELRILRKIHTSELDFEKQVKTSIAEIFEQRILRDNLSLSQPQFVSRLFAALVFEFFDEYIDDLHKKDDQVMQTQLNEFLHAANELFPKKKRSIR